jgi:uncharacterized protein YcbK (DUF882 family)
MKLTTHFSVEEWSQPARHGFEEAPYPPEWIESRLKPLCAALEVLRETLGKPITILSGFRSEKYNRSISGARLSQHVAGRASDLVVPGISTAKVHEVVLDLYRAGKIKIGGLGLYLDGKFVHVDVRPGERLARWEGSRKDT